MQSHIEKAKQQATTLGRYLSSIGRKITHGQSLEAVARLHQAKSWNVFVAQTDKRPPSQAGAGLAKAHSARVYPPVPAQGWTDDGKVRVDFDAAAWLDQAADHTILDLYAIGWGGNYEADEVLRFYDGVHPQVTELFHYLHTYSDKGGFECSVDGTATLAWVKVHRPKLFSGLMVALAMREGHPSPCEAEAGAYEKQYLGTAVSDYLGGVPGPQQGHHTSEAEESVGSKLTVLEVFMPDLVGDYNLPDEVPEWKWIQTNASFHHCSNGEEGGVWEFMVHVELVTTEGSHRHESMPGALRAIFTKAREEGVAWVMFYQS